MATETVHNDENKNCT